MTDKAFWNMEMQNIVENWAKEMNCDAVRLNSGMQRKEAHEFYKSLGYENTKAQKRFVIPIKWRN